MLGTLLSFNINKVSRVNATKKLYAKIRRGTGFFHTSEGLQLLQTPTAFHRLPRCEKHSLFFTHLLPNILCQIIVAVSVLTNLLVSLSSIAKSFNILR